MSSHIGIDLGTTNSVVASFEPESGVRIYKSPEQNEVTPSAIYFLDRKRRFYGARAYDKAAFAPESVAILFKRFMGTSTPIAVKALGLVLTPEDCSAEILRVLYSYLPEDLRNDSATGTVITVPAAFNQMQKDATLSAADAAGVGRVALMQEPVAAVMSVMRNRKTDGMFVIYDLGGGTLDVALAESLSGRVSLLEHGGIAMCGGRDWDRSIVDSVVKPWLLQEFDLASDFATLPHYVGLLRCGAWAAERAKIELSLRGAREVSIFLPADDIRIKDRSGREVYLDVPLPAATLDSLISARVEESVKATREVLERAHLGPQDVERMVFVGGPTKYKPLRDKVCFELGVPGSTEVDAMTAVAEGAAIFAESIDWSTAARGRKAGRGSVTTGTGSVQISFAYQARTPEIRANFAVQVKGAVAPGASFQVDSLDLGWSSGRIALSDGAQLVLPLGKNGDNRFKVFLFDAAGGAMRLQNDTIAISRTIATIDGIPASHSVGVAAKDKSGGRVVLDSLVKAGDPLPKKGRREFRAEQSLRAGGPGALIFELWEGDIESPYTDNLRVGAVRIQGSDLEEGGVIPAGAKLVCDFEMMDSGNIRFTVSVPSVGGTFGEGHNFYSRQEGLIDFSQAAEQVAAESDAVLGRVDAIAEKVDDGRLEAARERLQRARELAQHDGDPESLKQGMSEIQEARRQISRVRKDRLAEIRAVEMTGSLSLFDEQLRALAKPAEAGRFDSLRRTLDRTIGQPSGDFEAALDEIRSLIFAVLWRQEWWIVDRFKRLAAESYRVTDQAQFRQLVARGEAALRADDLVQLRDVVAAIFAIRTTDGGDAAVDVSIIRA